MGPVLATAHQVLGGLELGDGSQRIGKPRRHPAGFKSSSATDWLGEAPQPLIPPLDIGRTQKEARGQELLGDKTVGVSLLSSEKGAE